MRRCRRRRTAAAAAYVQPAFRRRARRASMLRPSMAAENAIGQQLKCLTVTNEWTREGLAIEVDGRIRSACVIEVLTRLVSERGAPLYLRSDNGPEFVSRLCSNGSSTIRSGPHSSLGYLTSTVFTARLKRQDTSPHRLGERRRTRRSPQAETGPKKPGRSPRGSSIGFACMSSAGSPICPGQRLDHRITDPSGPLWWQGAEPHDRGAPISEFF